MLGRASAFAAIAMLIACGGDPSSHDVKSPTSDDKSDTARAERKRKRAEERRRQEQEEADAAEREARKERMKKRGDDTQESQEPQETRVAQKEEEPAPSDDPDEIERRERKERIRKREEEEAREAKADAKKAKLEAAREAKQAKLEAEKAKKSKKKNVEEVDEADEEDVDEEEPKKKNVEEADEEVAADDEGSKSSPFKKTPRKPTAAEKKAAAKKLAAEKAAEKKAAEKQAAADRAAEKKAAAEAKKQAKKKPAEEKVADEAEEEAVEEEAPKQAAKSDKRKAEVDESEIEVDTASLPPPDPEHESDELDLTRAGTPARDEEPAVVAPPTYAIDRRPLTLGRGKIDVHGGLVASAVTTTPPMGMATTASAQGLALGATYGIGAKGELGIDYTLGLHPGDAQGPFMFHGAYVAKQTEKLDIALSLGLAFDFVDSIDPGTMMTTTRTAKAIQVGVWARYHLGAKLSAFSGLPALPSSAGNLGASAPLPPVPYQLSIGLSSVDAIALDIPAGLGYQATPKLYAFGVLDLAHLGMNNTTSALIFSDFIPLSLGGFYAAKKMDVGAVFSDDLKQGADYLRFDVVVRYSIK